MNLKVSVFLLCYNEEVLLPHTINHYKKSLPNVKFTIFDHSSTDKSVDIAKSLGCNIVSYQTKDNQIDDYKYLDIKNNCWRSTDDDWVIVCDMDEWLCIDEKSLIDEQNQGVTILNSVGASMIGDSKSETLEDIELGKLSMAIGETWLNKVVCFMPRHIKEINYTLGAHNCEPTGLVNWGGFYLLKHMDFLGLPFKLKKNRIRFERSKIMREEKNLAVHYIEDDTEITRHFEILKKRSRDIRKTCQCFD